jgi:hypothetical protein
MDALARYTKELSQFCGSLSALDEGQREAPCPMGDARQEPGRDQRAHFSCVMTRLAPNNI